MRYVIINSQKILNKMQEHLEITKIKQCLREEKKEEKAKERDKISWSWANSDGSCFHLRGAFNKFPDFFVQAFKIVVNSWTFSMLFLYIL